MMVKTEKKLNLVNDKIEHSTENKNDQRGGNNEGTK